MRRDAVGLISDRVRIPVDAVRTPPVDLPEPDSVQLIAVSHLVNLQKFATS